MYRIIALFFLLSLTCLSGCGLDEQPKRHKRRALPSAKVDATAHKPVTPKTSSGPSKASTEAPTNQKNPKLQKRLKSGIASPRRRSNLHKLALPPSKRSMLVTPKARVLAPMPSKTLAPVKVAPTPTAPAKVAPTPTAPAKVAPTPTAPAEVAPTLTAPADE